jgi:hypothetical protein
MAIKKDISSGAWKPRQQQREPEPEEEEEAEPEAEPEAEEGPPQPARTPSTASLPADELTVVCETCGPPSVSKRPAVGLVSAARPQSFSRVSVSARRGRRGRARPTSATRAT